MTTAAQPVPSAYAQPKGATDTAPSTPGTYAFQWEMVQDGVEHFGRYTLSLLIWKIHLTRAFEHKR